MEGESCHSYLSQVQEMTWILPRKIRRSPYWWKEECWKQNRRFKQRWKTPIPLSMMPKTILATRNIPCWGHRCQLRLIWTPISKSTLKLTSWGNFNHVPYGSREWEMCLMSISQPQKHFQTKPPPPIEVNATSLSPQAATTETPSSRAILSISALSQAPPPASRRLLHSDLISNQSCMTKMQFKTNDYSTKSKMISRGKWPDRRTQKKCSTHHQEMPMSTIEEFRYWLRRSLPMREMLSNFCLTSTQRNEQGWSESVLRWRILEMLLKVTKWMQVFGKT